MNEAAKVSVCIPVYNAEHDIEQYVRSLFNQTLQHGVEFMFVDNCTPDQIKALEDVLATHPHFKPLVKIIYQSQDEGGCRVRKVAMRYAVGAYIIHCDFDDQVRPTVCETLFRQAELTYAVMEYCDYVRSHSKEVQKELALEDLVDLRK